MAGSVTLNIGAIEERIVTKAMVGGQKGAEYALARIQARAPVRKLFRGTTYHAGADGFRAPRIRQARFKDPKTGEGGQVRGHANSLNPVFRLRQPNGVTLYQVGDYRRVDPDRPGRLGKIDPRAESSNTVVTRGSDNRWPRN